MEIQDGNENETFDDGLTGVSRFAQDLKKSIFGIVFVLLKDHEMSIYITIILCILEFIQVIGLCFHKEVINFLLIFIIIM